MPRNLLSLAQQFGGQFTMPGRLRFIITNESRLKTVKDCAAHIGARATVTNEKNIGGTRYVVLSVTYAN